MTEQTPMDQWMRDTVESLKQQLGEVASSVTDVRERLIRIEANPHGTQVERNAAEIGRLWSALDKVRADQARLELEMTQEAATAKGWERSLDWVYKLAPWAAAIILALSGNITVGL